MLRTMKTLLPTKESIKEVYNLIHGHEPFGDDNYVKNEEIENSWNRYCDNIIVNGFMLFWDSKDREWRMLKLNESIDSNLRIFITDAKTS